MDAEILARIQFALTAGFHFFYPPISIGLGLILVIMEGMYLKTKDPMYHRMTYFWVKVFALVFGIGVATGIVLEFEFGTNWSNYSRFVGDIFGSALAAEGVFAFFLESGFLAILVFGWHKVSPKVHFFSTIMVMIGSHFSAVWILVANSWMQTPAGYHVVTQRDGTQRAEIVDFWAMVFNPSTVDRLTHTVFAAWVTGAFLVTSVSAFYLLRNRHVEFAKASMKIGLTVAIIGSIFQIATGHNSANNVAINQPAKFSAFEGHWDSSAPADLFLFGYVDEAKQQTIGLKLPGIASFLMYGNPTAPAPGLDAIPLDERPPIQPVFQSFHLMVAIGFTLFALAVVSFIKARRNTLWDSKLLLKALVVAVVLPQLGNQLGWMVAEIGRQPWIVTGLMRTRDGLSRVVSAPLILTSILMFTAVYILLFLLFVYLLDKRIKRGPDEDPPAAPAPKGPTNRPLTQDRDLAGVN